MAVICNPSFMVVGILMQILVSGAVNFNLKTHVCCNGTVAERSEHTSCCGIKAFDSSQAVCCGTEVISFTSAEARVHHGCCHATSGSATAFDTRTHQCCDGKALEKPDNDTSYGCCSGVLFNATAEHLCCNGKLVDRAGSDSCCGVAAYNSSSHLCCQKWSPKSSGPEPEFSDIVVRKGPESDCCGRVAYDTATEVCCNDKVLVKPEGIAASDIGCCDGRVMDHQHQLCCRAIGNGTVGERLRNKTGSGSSCCGQELFDFHSEVCCNDTRLPKPAGVDKDTLGACCGDKVMTSFEFQLCDNGRLLERGGFNMWTCGEDGTLFNLTTHHCCMGKVLQNEADEGCCHLASRPYNKTTENCCGGEVVSLSEDDIVGQKFACCAPSPNFYDIDHVVDPKP